VYKLKGGFVNQIDYTQVITTRLFELAEMGEEKNFSAQVREMDIRVFKR